MNVFGGIFRCSVISAMYDVAQLMKLRPQKRASPIFEYTNVKQLCNTRRHSPSSYRPTLPTADYDAQLFSRVVCTNHCLFHVLGKDYSQLHMSLRPRGHSFNLPRYQYNLTRNRQEIFCFHKFILT